MIGELVDVRMLNGQMLAILNNPISAKDVENTILHIPYKGQGLQKDEKVEKAKLPSIAEAFYQYVFMFGVPTPEELITAYVKKHFHQKDALVELRTNSETYTLDGIKARVFRTYPSLIRDFHFYLLCYESKAFDKVYYSLESDFKQGIDVRVTKNGVHYAVALFVQTKRSKEFKQKKYGRHQALTMQEVCIEINPFDRTNYIGDYALYQPSHVKSLQQQIQQFQTSK